MTETEKYKLARHQRYASAMLDYNKGLLVAYDPGCGKTMVALDWIYRHLTAYHLEGDAENGVPDALVVCPASLCKSWEMSIDKMSAFEGYTDEGIDIVRRYTTITSFQKTYRTVTAGVMRNGRKKTEPVLREEVDKPWGVVVVDESQGIGSYSSKQTIAAHKLARLTEHRVCLTGTPVSGGGGQCAYYKLYGQIKFLYPDMWRSWSEFRRDYKVELDAFFKPVSYDNARCERLLKDYSVAARLCDCYDMPDRTDTVIDCPLNDPSARKAYKDIRKGKFDDYGLQIDQAGQQYLKLLQLCSGSIKRDKEGLPPLTYNCSKEQALMDVVDGTDDKIVVFCNYTATIDRLEKLFKARAREKDKTRPFDVVVKDGHHPRDDWVRFQNGDADIILCQYKAGGAGLDLFASHTMVLYEPNLSFLDYTQTVARIYRKGQTSNCRYIYLVTPDTLEPVIWAKVKAGYEVTERMMDEWASENRY